MNIDFKDISVIVQGKIIKTETLKCLKSIKKVLPGAEVILSTWEGEDYKNLDGLYDILVLNKDPKAQALNKIRGKVIYNNINRQLLSTQEGLKKASREYSFKMRSDLILTSDKFLEYFDKFQNRIDDYRLFEKKILTSTLFTRYNYKCGKQDRELMPFHISDWWLFGLTKDLRTYFMDTAFAEEPEFSNYFKLDANKNKNNPYNNTKYKFSPEQYFGYSCFNRNFDDIHMEDASDYNDELMEKFRKCLINNFIVLEYAQTGIHMNKYPYSKNERLSGDQYIGLYNFYRYENEYKIFCDRNYVITTDDKIFKNEEYGYALLRIYKHIQILTQNDTNLFLKLEQIFIGIPFSVIIFIIKYNKFIFQKETNK